MKICWRHLCSLKGESFQGFWILDQNGQPVNSVPFATMKSAKEAAKLL